MATILLKVDSRYPVDRKRMRLVVQRTLEKQGISSEMVVSIAVVGDRKMRALNGHYRHKDYATDVLSFPYLDEASSQDQGTFAQVAELPQTLGDIVVSYPQAVKQAREKNILVDDEVDFLIEHGMLHLLGIHHEE